jgi:hypothetical protein
MDIKKFNSCELIDKIQILLISVCIWRNYLFWSYKRRKEVIVQHIMLYYPSENVKRKIQCNIYKRTGFEI